MSLRSRAEELFRQNQQQLYRSTDRIFTRLLVLEFVAGLVLATTVSPFTWLGAERQLHIHVLGALVLGALLAFFPGYLVRRHSGEPWARYVIAMAQMGFSGLFIHLSGGRIETHFHIFGSLAFLAFYRDWKVLVPATIVVAGDHFIRSVFFPQSVFGIAEATDWRWIEHAAWVVFEDVFLIWSCLESTREMRRLAQQQAELEENQAGLERRVEERTARLVALNEQMCDLSRRAGMAEVASGVLHNVGNALNSVRVSASVAQSKVRGFRTDGLQRALNMLGEHQEDLAQFLTGDQRGRQLPTYLTKAVGELVTVQSGLLDELGRMSGGLDHIYSIVRAQQTHAGVTGITQCVAPAQLCEEALELCAPQLKDVEVERHLDKSALVSVEKHKILQVLVNLVSNAVQAMSDQPAGQRKLVVRSWKQDDNALLSVSDTGCGIDPENAPRLFEHGFTTRPDGHGFGLHNSAIQAVQSGGRLHFESRGRGLGATFTLELPGTKGTP